MPEKTTVTIGCRLPNGLIIHDPNCTDPAERGTQVKLNGPKLLVADGRNIGASFVTTEVDADFWIAWKKVYANYGPLVKGFIFEARNQSEATAKAKELQKEKTGFEQMPQQAMGVVKAVD